MPNFLMCYETDDSSVLASDPYLHAVNHPSSWIKEVIGHSKNIVRGIYALVSSVGEKPPTEAPYIVVLKFNAKLKGVLIESGNLLIRYDDGKAFFRGKSCEFWKLFAYNTTQTGGPVVLCHFVGECSNSLDPYLYFITRF